MDWLSVSERTFTFYWNSACKCFRSDGSKEATTASERDSVELEKMQVSYSCMHQHHAVTHTGTPCTKHNHRGSRHGLVVKVLNPGL